MNARKTSFIMRLQKGCLVFERLFKGRQSKLDEPIDRLLADIDLNGPDSPEYPQMIEQLERLIKLKALEPKARINPDTLLIVAGNLLGILIIVAYEQKHVVVSKGLNFVLKTKN